MDFLLILKIEKLYLYKGEVTLNVTSGAHWEKIATLAMFNFIGKRMEFLIISKDKNFQRNWIVDFQTLSIQYSKLIGQPVKFLSIIFEKFSKKVEGESLLLLLCSCKTRLCLSN